MGFGDTEPPALRADPFPATLSEFWGPLLKDQKQQSLSHFIIDNFLLCKVEPQHA
jgi:hypothetical protein